MKKAGFLAILICMFLVPGAAAAMEPISEAEMDAVTGQRGINFVIDDVQIYKNLGSGEIWYQDGTGGDTTGFGITGMHGMLDVNALLPGDNSGDPPQGIGNTGLKGNYNYDPDTAGYDYSGYYISDYAAAPGGVGVTPTVPVLSAGAGYNSGWAGSLAGVDSAIPGVMIYTPSVEIHAEMMIEAGMTTDPAGSTTRSFGEIYTRSTLTVMGGGFIEIVPGGKADIYHNVEESGWL
ncbi:MAG: hypothetical protein K9K62_06000 [Desulfobacteraceae bacterium]|nr:hypothetical protein [Desulfobacteraceae bacterium]